MILTFAPNPALERVALVERFVPGEAQKPMRVSTHAGGAGLRVANVVRRLGGEVLALAFVGGRVGTVLRDCLDKQDIPHVLTPTVAETRGSFLVIDKDQGVVTDIPEETAPTTPEEQEKLLTSLTRHLPNAKLLIVADDAEGKDTDLYVRAFAAAKEAEVPVIVDLRDGPLVSAIEAGVFALRVSHKTLQQQTETSLQHDSAILAEARSIVERGVTNVIVTLGEEGALLINATGAWRVQAPVVSHFNPTGSGQALTGAFAVHYLLTGDVVEATRYACAAASVNVTYDEPGYATPGEIAVLFPKTTAKSLR